VTANKLQPPPDLLLDRDDCHSDQISWTKSFETLDDRRMPTLLERDVVGVENEQRHAA
jgi:hypothetical protein